MEEMEKIVVIGPNIVTMKYDSEFGIYHVNLKRTDKSYSGMVERDCVTHVRDTAILTMSQYILDELSEYMELDTLDTDADKDTPIAS